MRSSGGPARHRGGRGDIRGLREVVLGQSEACANEHGSSQSAHRKALLQQQSRRGKTTRTDCVVVVVCVLYGV